MSEKTMHELTGGEVWVFDQAAPVVNGVVMKPGHWKQ